MTLHVGQHAITQLGAADLTLETGEVLRYWTAFSRCNAAQLRALDTALRTAQPATLERIRAVCAGDLKVVHAAPHPMRAYLQQLRLQYITARPGEIEDIDERLHEGELFPDR